MICYRLRKTELIKLQFVKLNSTHLQTHNHQPCNDMTWLYWKHCFSKSSSPKVPFWTSLWILKSNNFEINIKLFSGKTFFFRHWAVRSWASQTDPEFLTESQKSSQQNSAVFHTRQYSGTHYARFCEFFVLKWLKFKSQQKYGLLSYQSSFWHDFFFKIHIYFDKFRTIFTEIGYCVRLGKLDPQRTENKISIIQSRAKNLRQTFFITKEWLIQKSSKYLLNSSFSSGEHYQVYFLI